MGNYQLSKPDSLASFWISGVAVAVTALMAGALAYLQGLGGTHPTSLEAIALLNALLTLYTFGIGVRGNTLVTQRLLQAHPPLVQSLSIDVLALAAQALLLALACLTCLIEPLYFVCLMGMLGGANMLYLGWKIEQFNETLDELQTSRYSSEVIGARRCRSAMTRWLRLNGVYGVALGLALGLLAPGDFQAFALASTVVRSLVDLVWCREFYGMVLGSTLFE